MAQLPVSVGIMDTESPLFSPTPVKFIVIGVPAGKIEPKGEAIQEEEGNDVEYPCGPTTVRLATCTEPPPAQP